MAKGKSVQVNMTKEKDCKTCKRFKAASAEDGKKMQTVYINNEVLEALGEPDNITVSIAVTE